MEINGLVPDKKITDIGQLPVYANPGFGLKTGDPRILDFLNHLSKKIITDPFLKKDASYVALGFWLRKANINRILKENRLDELIQEQSPGPVGLVFHLCPSNVDTMFFYSLTLALLGGNKNLIRVSSRLEEPAVFRLFELINELVAEEGFSLFQEYINIVSYDRDDEINELFSQTADARIIWGGDTTIDQFKKYKTRHRVKDLYFTDRTSFSVIRVTEKLRDQEIFSDLCKRLYTDIYTFDQMGCSSPHCIFIVGGTEERNTFADEVYQRISEMAEEVYERDISSMASFKLNKSVDDLLQGTSSVIRHQNNYFVMADLLVEEVPHSCGMGYVYYKGISHLKDLLPFLNDKVQTIGMEGFTREEMQELLSICPPNSVHRVVPVGKALDFDYIWDGYNIFLEMLNFRAIKK